MKRKSIRVSGLVQAGAISDSQAPAGALPAFAKKSLPLGGAGEPLLIPVGQISPNPYQPRTAFPAKEMEELAGSIKEVGLIQPIAVRRSGEGGYQIIAGERRWRAHGLLGAAEIPAYVHDCADGDMAVLALSENMDRADLSDYEIGKAVRRIEALFPSKTRLAEALGMAREDLYRYLAFEALPGFLLERLDANPALLSRSAACDIRRVLGGAGAEDPARAEDALRSAVDLLEAGRLDQTKLAAHVLALLKAGSGAGAAAGPGRHHPIHLGEAPVGSVRVGPNGVVVKIKPGVVGHDRAEALRALIADFIAGEAGG